MPGRHRADERFGLVQGEHAVGRAPGRAGKLVAGARLDPAAGIHVGRDGAGELEPGALTAVGGVKRAPGAGVEQCERGAGQVFRAGRPAALVVHHPQVVALRGEPRDGAGKVVAPRGVDPAGPDQQMVAAGLPQQAFAHRLAAPVGVDRIVWPVGQVGVSRVS